MDEPAPRYTLIRDLPQGDRPRERLRDSGAQALSIQELLAILLRVGSSGESALAQASRLLSRFEGLKGLYHAPFAELCGEPGLGEAKSAQIKAALELGMRLAKTSPADQAVIGSPEAIADMMLAEMSLLQQEEVRVVLLDTRNHVLGRPTVYVGSVHTAQVRIGELLADALRVRAVSIVLLHNHPSSDPKPSAADIQITKQLFEAANMMGIELLDHLIIGGNEYVSMKHLRLGFPGATA